VRNESVPIDEILSLLGRRRGSFRCMPRPLRPQIPGAIHHVTARGVDGCAIYRDSRDRVAFLDRLADVVDRCKWQLLAYCLMTNHYHLVVRTSWPTLSRGVQRLNGMHAQRFNQRHRRRGHLFGARFGSPRLESDAHLLLACRYTVRNPVRAGLCTTPAAWRWSSFRATAGLSPAPAFLAAHELLPLLGSPTEEGARAAYRRFVEEPLRAERLAA
jgi:putative transposase